MCTLALVITPTPSCPGLPLPLPGLALFPGLVLSLPGLPPPLIHENKAFSIGFPITPCRW